MPEATTDQIGKAATALAGMIGKAQTDPLFNLLCRIYITPGRLGLCLQADAIAREIGVEGGDLVEDALAASFPFQLRKRGVETRIILSDAGTGSDEVLIRNIAKAHAWFERIKAGETFSDIASTEGASKRRIQQMIALAFLAPDIIRDVMDGKQPVGFTSDWCLRHELPSEWTKQRQLTASL